MSASSVSLSSIGRFEMIVDREKWEEKIRWVEIKLRRTMYCRQIRTIIYVIV